MKIAGIQFTCSAEKEHNTEKILRTIEVAHHQNAKIVCFHELCNVYWFPKDIDSNVFSLADSLESPFIQLMKKRAKLYNMVIILPIFEKDGDRYYNTCVVINSDGEVLGLYRKIHIPDIPLWEERFYFSSGDKGFPVFETSYGKIGVQISWDNLYPEGTRILALKGADIVFAPTACAFKTQHLWQTVISGNAITNGIYIMRVNRVGSETAQDFYGASFCINPEGEFTGGPTGNGDIMLVADIDFNYLKDFRREWPIMKTRRPDQYTEILNRTDANPDTRPEQG